MRRPSTGMPSITCSPMARVLRSNKHGSQVAIVHTHRENGHGHPRSALDIHRDEATAQATPNRLQAQSRTVNRFVKLS